MSSSENSDGETNVSISSRKKEMISASESSSESDGEEAPAAPKIKVPAPVQTLTLNPLEGFIKENKNLERLSLSTAITQHEDVCILDVPKNVDPYSFIQKTINFDSKTKVKLNGTKFIIEPCSDEVKGVTLFGKKLQIIHPVSMLKMREYKKSKHKSEIIHLETVTPSLPENLKVRHPLFGSEYKKKIVLSDEVEQKLDQVIEKELKKMKKKKKKKVENMEESISDLLESHIAKKKKKVDTMNQSVQENGIEEPSKKKKKKIKVEPNLDESVVFKIKKIKKEKIAEDKSPKKRNSLLNSTPVGELQLPSFEFDVSTIINRDESLVEIKKEKNKQKKNDSVDESFNLGKVKKEKHKSKKRNESEEESPKKKIKKEKVESDNDDLTKSLILSLLDKVKGEIGSPKP